MEAVKVQAEQKQIKLVSEIDENLPDVKADTEKTAWVLINFLTNAIRYSQSEETKIIIAVKQENAGVLFSVKDEGKGIDSRYREKDFRPLFSGSGKCQNGYRSWSGDQ